MRAGAMILVSLLLAPVARAQSLRVTAAGVPESVCLPPGIELVCAVGYPADRCGPHVAALARELAAHPLDQLGSWTFALAPSAGWADLVRSLGGDPVSPAFSVLDRRVTVL